MANVHVAKYFNQFGRGKIKEDILKRVIIHGINGNNQYGQAMKNALLHGCIKNKKRTILLEFNIIFNKFSHDKIGHLFVVDIKFYNF